MSEIIENFIHKRHFPAVTIFTFTPHHKKKPFSNISMPSMHPNVIFVHTHKYTHWTKNNIREKFIRLRDQRYGMWRLYSWKNTYPCKIIMISYISKSPWQHKRWKTRIDTRLSAPYQLYELCFHSSCNWGHFLLIFLS